MRKQIIYSALAVALIIGTASAAQAFPKKVLKKTALIAASGVTLPFRWCLYLSACCGAKCDALQSRMDLWILKEADKLWPAEEEKKPEKEHPETKET